MEPSNNIDMGDDNLDCHQSIPSYDVSKKGKGLDNTFLHILLGSTKTFQTSERSRHSLQHVIPQAGTMGSQDCQGFSDSCQRHLLSGSMLPTETPSAECTIPSPLAPVFVPRRCSGTDGLHVILACRPIVTGGQPIFPTYNTPGTTPNSVSSAPSPFACVFVPRAAREDESPCPAGDSQHTHPFGRWVCPAVDTPTCSHVTDRSSPAFPFINGLIPTSTKEAGSRNLPAHTSERRSIVMGTRRFSLADSSSEVTSAINEPSGTTQPSAMVQAFIPRLDVAVPQTTTAPMVKRTEAPSNPRPYAFRLTTLEMQLQEDELASRAARVRERGRMRSLKLMEVPQRQSPPPAVFEHEEDEASSGLSCGDWSDDDVFFPEIKR